MDLKKILANIVGNKVKGRISKLVFQENKARQFSNSSYPLIHTRTCAYQGVKMFVFSENLACFIFLEHPFWDSPIFALLPTILCTFWNTFDQCFPINENNKDHLNIKS